MIYKPTDLSPSAQTFDVKDTPIFFECKVDTSNVQARGFTITVLDSENNVVFSSIPEDKTLDKKYITLIDQVREYVGDGSTVNYSGQERIGKFASYVEGYNLVNTGYNGTYLKFPFSVAFADRATNTVGINQIFYSEIALNDEPYQSGLYKYKKNDDGSININAYDSVEIYNGQEYKWSITLYQLENIGDERNPEWILPENPLYYDMPLTTGTVLGSNDIRIQGVYSDEIYGDYFVQPVLINGLKYDAENPVGWAYVNAGNEESTIYENNTNRVLIKSYDSTYGYIYPTTGEDGFAADTIVPTNANGFRIYKRGNSPENLTTYQQVVYVCENPIDDSTDPAMVAKNASWTWSQSLASPGESYGTLVYYEESNPNGAYNVPNIGITLQGNERVILNHQSTGASNSSGIYQGSPLNGIYYPQFSVKNPVAFNADSNYMLGDLVLYNGHNYSCMGAIQGKTPGGANSSYYWRLYTEQTWNTGETPPAVTVSGATEYNNTAVYKSGDTVYIVTVETTLTKRTYYQCRGVVKGGDPVSDAVGWSIVSSNNNYAITVNWFRTPDADSWGELMNKIVLVTNGGSPYYGKNLQIKDINENSDAYGMINETPFMFVQERPVEIYKEYYALYEYGNTYNKGDIVKYTKRPISGAYSQYASGTSYTPGEIVFIQNGNKLVYYVCIKANTGQQPGGTNNQYWNQYKAQSYYISLSDNNAARPISDQGVLANSWTENPYLGNTGVIFYNNQLGEVDPISSTDSTNGRLYIRRFEGIQPGMLLMKNSNNNIQQYVNVQNYNSDYNFITYDKVYTFDTYEAYHRSSSNDISSDDEQSNPYYSSAEDVNGGREPANQVGAGTKYQIKTFFRESDENAFYFYTTPVVTLHYANSNGVDFIEDRVLTQKYYKDYAGNISSYDSNTTYAIGDVCKTTNANDSSYWEALVDNPQGDPGSTSSWEQVTGPWTKTAEDSSSNYTYVYNQYFSYNKDDIVSYDNKRDFLLYNSSYEYSYGDKIRYNGDYYISIKNKNKNNIPIGTVLFGDIDNIRGTYYTTTINDSSLEAFFDFIDTYEEDKAISVSMDYNLGTTAVRGFAYQLNDNTVKSLINLNHFSGEGHLNTTIDAAVIQEYLTHKNNNDIAAKLFYFGQPASTDFYCHNLTITDQYWQPVTIDSSYDTTIQYIALTNVPVGYAPCQEHLGLYWQQYIGVLFENEGYVTALQYYNNVAYKEGTNVLYNGLYYTVAKDNESYTPGTSSNEHGDQVWVLKQTYDSGATYSAGTLEWGAPVDGVDNTSGLLCRYDGSSWSLYSGSHDDISYSNGKALSSTRYLTTFNSNTVYMKTADVFYEGLKYTVIANTSIHVPKFDESTEYFVRSDKGRPLNYPNSITKSWKYTSGDPTETTTNSKKKYLMGDIVLSKGSSYDCLPDRYWVKIINTDSTDSSTFDIEQFIPNLETWQAYYGPTFAGKGFDENNSYEYNNVILDEEESGLYFIKKNINNSYDNQPPISPLSLSAWDVAKVYTMGDKVVYNNTIYICKADSASGQKPAIESSVWDVYPWQLYIPEITERTLRVSAKYNQQQYVQWKSAQWFLFDAEGENIIEKSEVFYDGNLSYTFHGLEGRDPTKTEDKFFIVRLIIETYNGYRMIIDETIETMFSIIEIDSEGLINVTFDCDTASVVTTVTKESGFIVPSDATHATYDLTKEGNVDEGVMHLDGLMRYQKVSASIESMAGAVSANPILSAADRFVHQIDTKITTDIFGGELFGLRSYSGPNDDVENTTEDSKIVGNFSIYIPEVLKYIEGEKAYPNDSVLREKSFIALDESKNYLKWIANQVGTPYSGEVLITSKDNPSAIITSSGDLTNLDGYKSHRTVPLNQKNGFDTNIYSETNYLPIDYEFTIESSQDGLNETYFNVDLEYNSYTDKDDFTRGDFTSSQDFHLIQDPLLLNVQFNNSSNEVYSSTADSTEFSTAVFTFEDGSNTIGASSAELRVRANTSTMWSDYLFKIPGGALVGYVAEGSTEYFTKKNVWDTKGWRWTDSSMDSFWVDADYITKYDGYQNYFGGVYLNGKPIDDYMQWFNGSSIDIVDEYSNTIFKPQDKLEQKLTERAYLNGKEFLFDVDLTMDADGFIAPTELSSEEILKVVAYSVENEN